MKAYGDKGHGERGDPGAVSDSFVEHPMNVVVVDAWAERMRQYGWNIKLEEGNLEIGDSARAANNWGADLLISFHFNAGGGDRGEVICSWEPGALELAKVVAEGLKKAGQSTVKVYKSKANRAGNAEHFGILRISKMPAVIVEPCFIDNVTDRQMADTNEELKHIGYCIADAMAAAYGGTPIESEDDDMKRYERLSDIPNEYGFQDVIETLMNAKIISGDGSDKAGNNDVIDLSHDQVRSLVFEYRGGAFDRKLIAEGLKPAVKI